MTLQHFQNPKKNFNKHIASNSYPGRGLIVGRSSIDDSWLMLYWIMGRSEHSRNRRFKIDGSVLRTEPVSLSRMDAPELVIYPAMLELPNIYIVANGDQSQTIYDTLSNGGTFDNALATREREPDAPNYTSRISGILVLTETPTVILNALNANSTNPAHTDRVTYRPAQPMPGLGLCLTTYMGDGNPLPRFIGDPLVMPIEGKPEEVMQTYWNALNNENRISIALKRIERDGSSELMVINKY